MLCKSSQVFAIQSKVLSFSHLISTLWIFPFVPMPSRILTTRYIPFPEGGSKLLLSLFGLPLSSCLCTTYFSMWFTYRILKAAAFFPYLCDLGFNKWFMWGKSVVSLVRRVVPQIKIQKSQCRFQKCNYKIQYFELSIQQNQKWPLTEKARISHRHLHFSLLPLFMDLKVNLCQK